MVIAGTLSAQMFTKVLDSPLSTTNGDSRSVNWVDVNGDGYIDCFISNGPQLGQNNMLYINDTNGNFTKVTDDPIVKDGMPSDGATFADIDNDGDLDAFVVNWYNKNNLAYINDGTGKFTRVLDGTWVNHLGYSETASFGDYNNDGLVDLYVTNSEGNKKNFLYKNLGSHMMESIAEGSPVTDAGASRNVSWVDIDNDRDPDLFVTNENGEKDHLYRNDGGGLFTKLTEPLITVDQFSTMSGSWGDIDNDGDLDVFLANDGSKNQLFRNDGNFTFTRIITTDISIAVVVMDQGWSYGCAFGDYDNDGFQDLAVATTRFGNADEPDYLYHNNGNENHWLMVSLEGRTTNHSAIGAKVRVKAVLNGAAIWQMREISAQSAYCSQNDMRAHFGLGDAVLVDSIVIEWPSGIVQHMTNVLPNQILAIEEDLVNAVSPERPSFGLKIFPNPTSSSIQLEAHFTNQSNELLLEVFGDTGQIVYSSTFSHVSGLWQHHLDLKKLQLIPGQYIVRLSNGVSGEERKVIFIQ